MKMSENELLIELKDAIIGGEIKRTKELVKRALDLGLEYKHILDKSIIKGAEEVGKLYEQEEYFLADLLMTGDSIAVAMEALKPAMESSLNESKGKILVGTVEGDVHDIGKCLVVSLLLGQGYEVIDLGVDVSPKAFIEKAKELKPEIIGLSGLITTSLSKMHETVIELKKEGILSKVIIGGGMVSRLSCDRMGADDCAKDGWEGVKKV